SRAPAARIVLLAHGPQHHVAAFPLSITVAAQTFSLKKSSELRGTSGTSKRCYGLPPRRLYSRSTSYCVCALSPFRCIPALISGHGRREPFSSKKSPKVCGGGSGTEEGYALPPSVQRGFVQPPRVRTWTHSVTRWTRVGNLPSPSVK